MLIRIVTVMLLLRATMGMGQERCAAIRAGLDSMGFQNVRVVETDSGLVAGSELNTYRWSKRALAETGKLLDQYNKGEKTIFIPTFEGITLYPLLYSGGGFSRYKPVRGSQFPDIRREPADNPHRNRLKLLIWPQVRIQNQTYRQLYEIQLNVAPELQFNIAKGLSFHAQVIFPLVNQIEEEGQYIRPGIVALNQRFKIRQNGFGLISAGKFTDNRYGADLRFLHLFDGGRFSLGANFGLTGYNAYISNRFIYSGLDTFTWKFQAGWFIKHFNSMVNLNFGQYLAGDYGMRFNAVRFFGETAVGFWVAYAGGEPNGGFNFSVPLPPARYKGNRRLRIRLPDYFFWEYQGRVWPKEGRCYNVQNDYFYFNNIEPLKQFNRITFN